MSVVLVTGGTGFLGAEICRQLAARGDLVHVLARASSDKTVLDGLPVQWHAGDLTDPESIRRAAHEVAQPARGAHRRALLVHSGALISYRTADRRAQELANAEGTRHVFAAAIDARFARVLHVSSVVAVGHSETGAALDESHAYNGGALGCDYTTTKHQAELHAGAVSENLDVVIVNPGAIFGPVTRNSNTARFIRRVAQGHGPPVAPPGSISVVGVEDTARGALLALDHGRRGQRYILVESWMTSLELFHRIARELGRRGPLFAIPRWAWPAIVAGARMVDRMRPIDLTPPQALRMLACEMRFDASRARAELGWRPRPFAEVLAQTIASLRARGLLDEPA